MDPPESLPVSARSGRVRAGVLIPTGVTPVAETQSAGEDLDGGWGVHHPVPMHRKRTAWHRWLPVALALSLTIGGGCRPQAESGPDRSGGTTSQRLSAIETRPVRDASDDFFEADRVYRITLRMTETQLERLRTEPRSYTQCTLAVEGEQPLTDVAVKLKGAAGSFQELDGKPAFTLNVGKFLKGQEFHRLRKFHLNNSVQDESYTSEWLCTSISRDLGIPAARVAHARVWLNDRDLGLYVLKEGFDRNFLRRNFIHPGGNLYDGGFCQEIDAELERDEGRGPDDRSDLQGLLAACLEPDPALRAERVAQKLDVAAFRTFMAFELLIAHWDGYCGNRNNYRVYFAPPSGKAYFLPHGMDQTFGDSEFPLFADLGGVVPQAVWRGDEAGRREYREVVRQMLERLDPQVLSERVNRLQERLKPALAELDEELARRTDDWKEDWRHRLESRWASAARQLTEPDHLEPPVHEEWQEIEEPDMSQPVLLGRWYPQKQTEDASLGEEPGDPLAPWNRPATDAVPEETATVPHQPDPTGAEPTPPDTPAEPGDDAPEAVGEGEVTNEAPPDESMTNVGEAGVSTDDTSIETAVDDPPAEAAASAGELDSTPEVQATEPAEPGDTPEPATDAAPGAEENPEPADTSEAEASAGEPASPEGQPEPVPVVICTVGVGDSGDCIASWRKRVRLPPGNYRVTLWARVQGVVPREGDDRGPGAGVRLSGQNRETGLVGTTDWTELVWDFEVGEEQPEVELVAELRATAGQAWFRTPARLERK